MICNIIIKIIILKILIWMSFLLGLISLSTILNALNYRNWNQHWMPCLEVRKCTLKGIGNLLAKRYPVCSTYCQEEYSYQGIRISWSFSSLNHFWNRKDDQFVVRQIYLPYYTEATLLRQAPCLMFFSYI